MALTHTDRGDFTAAYSNPAAASVNSGFFTPPVGALITVCLGSGNADGGAGACTYTFTHTAVGGAWVIVEEHSINDGGTFSMKTMIAYGVVTSNTADIVTATRSGGADGTFSIQVDEWSGQAGSPAGLHNSADDGRASGATLTVGFGGTPASTSGAVGIIADNNGSATGAVPPTGWTESADIGDTSSGTSYEAAWILGSAQASPQWTSLQSGLFGKTGSVLEILQAGGTPDDALTTPPIRQLNVYRM